MATVDIPGDDAVHAIEIASIGITLINALSSAVLVLLVLFDNVRHQKSWWNISWERRVPFYLGLSVLFSHVVFATREFLEFNSVNATDGNATNGCVATNESSWWAIWFPLIATSIRVLLMATSIILKYEAFSTPHECMYIFLVTAISIPLWVPAHIFDPAPCSPFIMVFSPQSNSSLGITAMIILGVFLLVICLALLTITWDTCRPPPPQRRSLYLEFDPAGLEGHFSDTSHNELLAAKKTLIYYGLAIFCLYACLLPNFAMIGTSRNSEATIYIATIAIHTTGIVVLFQYLLMRKGCVHCDGKNSTNTLRPQTSDTNQLPDQLRHSLSTTSHEFTRKRRRPYTTYGGGGVYLQRESSGSSWESFQKSIDRTASGRKIPVRSQNSESRPRTAESRPETSDSKRKAGDRTRDLRRSKSFAGVENAPPIPRQDSAKSSSSKSSTEKEQVNENAPSSPKRQSSVRKLRRRSDRIVALDESIERKEDTVDDRKEDSVITSEEIENSMLKPVLLPPLTNPRRTRSFRRNGSQDSDRSITPPPSTFLRSIPIPVQLHDSPLPTSSPTAPIPSDFVFPFRSDPSSTETQGTSQSQTSPKSAGDDLEPHPSWPLHLEDLLEPDPPFAAEDRHYISPTPSESRLSTITEEGTVRESTVVTPPNLVGADRSNSRSTSNPTPSTRTVTPMSPSLANWFSQGGAQYSVNDAMN